MLCCCELPINDAASKLVEKEVSDMLEKDDGVETSELEQYRICAACIGEEFLKAKVQSDGESAGCFYCRNEQKTISIGELADAFESVFEDHFCRTPDEPSGLEYTMMNDPESHYEWERVGERVTDVIVSTAEIEETPAEHVRLVLDERHYDIEDAKMGQESPFDSEAHYEEKGPEDHELLSNWSYFQKSLKTEARLFNREAQGILDSIFEGLTEHTTREGNPVIVDAGPGQPIAQFFRARVFQSGDKLEAALMRPDKEIGPPPSFAAIAGRMNARGISVFYGATDPVVALAEVRPPVGSRVAVARFELIRPVRLLDVEALRSIYVTGSFFDRSYIRRLEKARFLGRLSDRIIMPVMPEDEASDYLVTQAIADYLANRTEPAIDGLIYRSIQNGDGGLNVALFYKSSRVEMLNIPEGTEIKASLDSWTDEGLETDYHVWEETPPEKPKENESENDLSFPALHFAQMQNPDDDLRVRTLRLDVTTLQVHHVNSVTFGTVPFTVPRRRSAKREHKF